MEQEGAGKKILVVDDKEDNRVLVRKVLGRRGYEVNFEFAGVHVNNDRYIVHYEPKHDIEPVIMLVSRCSDNMHYSQIWHRELNPISGAANTTAL